MRHPDQSSWFHYKAVIRKLSAEGLDAGYGEMIAIGRHQRKIFVQLFDKFFDYAHGPLSYYGIRFERRIGSRAEGLSVGTVNYPNEFDFRRTTDQRHLAGASNLAPLLITEYQEQCTPGIDGSYYSIPSSATSALLEPYLADSAKLDGQVLFTGCPSDDAYYNMGQACGRTLALFEKRVAPVLTGETV